MLFMITIVFYISVLLKSEMQLKFQIISLFFTLIWNTENDFYIYLIPLLIK
jgi:hypothetical protein